jgi:hypothetical protein
MGKIVVDVDVLVGEKFVRMFRNVKLEVEETSNRKMNLAFEEQHPKLFAKIPRRFEIVNGIGTVVEGISPFECKPHY